MSSVCKYNDVFVPKIEVIGTVGFIEMSVKLDGRDTYEAALKHAKQWIEDHRNHLWYCASIRIEKYSTTW